MKIVISMDSFKESLTSLQAGNAVRRGILSVMPDVEALVLPLADGGEGTIDALVAALGGKTTTARVIGPLGKPVDAVYGIIEGRGLAIIEIVQAAGLHLLDTSERNPMNTTTFGVGELILDALDRGCREFIVGLGGSATNDAGIGMLSALGFRFNDSAGRLVGVFGRDVGKIHDIDISQADERLKSCRFSLACDVNNPLCGKNGASAVFGPQKGITPLLIDELDGALLQFSRLTAECVRKDLSWEPGAGAAGGLGFGFLAYLNASVRRGIEVVMEAVGLEAAVTDADFVITGEGKLDSQTVMGKAPHGVAKLAKKHGAAVIAFSGCASESAIVCNSHGIDAYFPILSMPLTLEEAISVRTAEQTLESMSRQVFLLIRAIHDKANVTAGNKEKN